jgi:predicted metal-dependent hydrolase
MRYLLIAENPGFSVSHREELLRRLRAVLPVIAVRIATGHVEVDVKTDDLEKAVAEVEKVVGRVLDVVDITFEDVGGGVERYVDLFNRERFWEAHNALEGLWRKTRNTTLQGLIMLAAAFVKLQEGQPDKFERMLKEALHLLKEDVGCIKMERLLEKAEKALLEKRPFKIECP